MQCLPFCGTLVNCLASRAAEQCSEIKNGVTVEITVQKIPVNRREDLAKNVKFLVR